MVLMVLSFMQQSYLFFCDDSREHNTVLPPISSEEEHMNYFVFWDC